MKAESISLHSTRDGSDKLYDVQLEQRDGGWVVCFQYGRRGGALRPGMKTQEPVAYAEAKKVFDRVVSGQVKSGYQPIGASGGYQPTEFSQNASGIDLQLLVEIDGTQRAGMLRSSRWGLQEKWNGERRACVLDGDVIRGVNKKGQWIALSLALVDVLRRELRWAGRTVIDGEQIGDTFCPFDLLERNGEDLRGLPYSTRLALLEDLFATSTSFPMPVTHRESAEKEAFRARLSGGGFEGVVWKSLDSRYVAGRAHEAAYKDKFVQSATVRVIGVNSGKRSVSIEAMDESTATWHCIGNVTILANLPVPPASSVVEVSYLYFESSLVQPVYLGVRSDQVASDCLMSQLKRRAAVPHSAAA